MVLQTYVVSHLPLQSCSCRRRVARSAFQELCALGMQRTFDLCKCHSFKKARLLQIHDRFSNEFILLGQDRQCVVLVASSYFNSACDTRQTRLRRLFCHKAMGLHAGPHDCSVNVLVRCMVHQFSNALVVQSGSAKHLINVNKRLAIQPPLSPECCLFSGSGFLPKLQAMQAVRTVLNYGN